MPPEIKTDRKTMIDGIMSLIEERGYGAVSARSIAERLGISTQPVYREFGDMEGVRVAAIERGYEIFSEYIAGEALNQASSYVMFAIEHANLFNFLFRGKHYEYDGLDDLSHKLISTDIIDKLQAITGLSCEEVYRVHLVVWMALHGLAAISADNNIAVGKDEVEQFTKDITNALTRYYRR